MAFPLAIPQTYDFETGLWQFEGSDSELQRLLLQDWITYHSSAKLSDGRILRLGFRVDDNVDRIRYRDRGIRPRR